MSGTQGWEREPEDAGMNRSQGCGDEWYPGMGEETWRCREV